MDAVDTLDMSEMDYEQTVSRFLSSFTDAPGRSHANSFTHQKQLVPVVGVSKFQVFLVVKG